MFSPVRWELRCSGMGKTVAGHGRRRGLAIVGRSTDSMLHLSDQIFFKVLNDSFLVLKCLLKKSKLCEVGLTM